MAVASSYIRAPSVPRTAKSASPRPARRRLRNTTTIMALVRRRGSSGYGGREEDVALCLGFMAPVSDSWQQGDPYEQYVGRWSRRLARRFLSWLFVPRGRRWLGRRWWTGGLRARVI